jgi:hypothetical protein
MVRRYLHLDCSRRTPGGAGAIRQSSCAQQTSRRTCICYFAAATDVDGVQPPAREVREARSQTRDAPVVPAALAQRIQSCICATCERVGRAVQHVGRACDSAAADGDAAQQAAAVAARRRICIRIRDRCVPWEIAYGCACDGKAQRSCQHKERPRARVSHPLRPLPPVGGVSTPTFGFECALQVPAKPVRAAGTAAPRSAHGELLLRTRPGTPPPPPPKMLHPPPPKMLPASHARAPQCCRAAAAGSPSRPRIYRPTAAGGTHPLRRSSR